jgi:hypothetical protein
MADPSSIAASKLRIITHMNNDHADSVDLYAQHFCKLSQSAARGAKLTKIDLDGMTISASGKEHRISLSPPMKSFAEARTRTVDMDREARTALDISSTKLTIYTPPTSPFHVFVFGICTFMFCTFVFYGYIVPGTFFYDSILPYFPFGPEMFKWIVRMISLPVLVIHFGEAYMMDKTRLRKYGVQRGTTLWWKWIGSCFIEGYGCWVRIDKEIQRKEGEAQNTKH